ncbi:MAG: leucine-rich repeat protein [Clostridia bacterium]|nr:leucine-rich repeat protein [Clostridia bacterium]
MTKRFRRILCTGLATLMTASLVLEHNLRAETDAAVDANAQTNSAASFTDVTGKFDTTGVVTGNFNSSVLENISAGASTRTVIVSLKGNSILEYAKGEDVGTYLETRSGKSAQSAILAQQNELFAKLNAAKINYTVQDRYSAVDNAVAIEVNTKYISQIKKFSMVDTVVVAETYAYPQTAADDVATGNAAQMNETKVHATGVYDTSVFYEKYQNYGEGTMVAVLDTGLDYTHGAFQRFYSETVDLAFPKSRIETIFADQELSAEKKSLDTANYTLKASDVYISDKIPFAYDYADDDFDVYPSYSNHGAHVAGIVGGYDPNGYEDKDGVHHDEAFMGAAPDAQLMICKVFTDDLDDKDLGGAVTNDILAALEDCIILGVDVINMSLGTSAGFSSTGFGEDDEGDYLQTVYNAIRDVGISLVCAASNDYSSAYGGTFGTNLASNPDSGTVGSPGTYQAALAVASISGQLSLYMIANQGTDDQIAVYYEESNDENNNPFDFAERMLSMNIDGLAAGATKFEFEYVVAGKGTTTDLSSVRSLFMEKPYQRIALIERGGNTFQEKVENAIRAGAGAVIVYNNVAGTIRMSLGEIDDPFVTPTNVEVPVRAVSINMAAGEKMVAGAGNDKLGKITVDTSLEAGPFMSDFSSWGATPDLKLKPEITAHGGEITSTVPGGYDEQSGTSMASPNMAGVTALVRSYIKYELQENLGISNAVEINRLTNQLIMSTATIAYDRESLPYSPRKQGAGLASLENILNTGAYLSTSVAENDYRPKYELYDQLERNRDLEDRVYFEVPFEVTNFSAEDIYFTTSALKMTETLGVDGLAVAEKAYLLDEVATKWRITGEGYETLTLTDGERFKVPAGKTLQIVATMTVSASEEKYIKDTFVNGMYVEGFIELIADKESAQCNLVLPYLGFYGDWTQAPMLDYTVFELAEYEQDGSIDDENKPKERVWATQPYASYYGEKYIVPMGSYVYTLPEYTSDPVFEKMYANEDYCAVSCYSIEGDEDGIGEYMTANAIKAVYAGLLRNAREVNYSLYNEDTGELLKNDTLYRVGKAYTAGGSAIPANVELNLSPIEQEFASGTKYRMYFEFFLDYNGGEGSNKNTYEFTFTVDYEAPVLQDLRVSYEDYEENNIDKQRVKLELDIYDNHYAQSVMLLYLDKDEAQDAESDVLQLNLATDYIIPVRDPVKNGVKTVKIDITDFYDDYKTGLYVQIDDYALNHTLYKLNMGSADVADLPDEFELVEGNGLTVDEDGNGHITIGVNEAVKIGLAYEGDAHLANFSWSSASSRVKVSRGEIFGAQTTSSPVRVRVSGKTASNSKYIYVTVIDKGLTLGYPSVSFGLVKKEMQSIAKAVGTVDVNPGETFALKVIVEPWYFDVSNYKFRWNSTNPAVASVDENGNITTHKRGSATISATLLREDGVTATSYGATVTLAVQDPFKVSNFTLTDYQGPAYNETIELSGGESVQALVVPLDKNIMYIGEDAFKDNTDIEYIVLPKTVTEIQESAFEGCTSLKAVYFIDAQEQAIADANLKLIHKWAFKDCTALETVDFSNVKTFTVAAEVFKNCTSLSNIVDFEKIGTLHDRAFENCVSLTGVNLSGLHLSGEEVFKGCEKLQTVITAQYTAIGEKMFAGLEKLESVVIHSPKVGAGAFENCTGLKSVTFVAEENTDVVFEIGANAFKNCAALASVVWTNERVRVIGGGAFEGCSALAAFTMPNGLEELGSDILKNTGVTTVEIGADFEFAALRRTGLLFSDISVTLKNDEATAKKYQKGTDGVIYALDEGTQERVKILLANEATGAYIVPDTVREILAYAFAGSQINSIKWNAALSQIGVGAFENSSLSSIDWNGNTNITELPAYAFAGTKLASVSLGESVEKIGAYAFASSSLAAIEMPKVTAVEDYAFRATQFVAVDWSASAVIEMGNGVFGYCELLQTAKLPALKTLGAFTFVGSQVKTVEFAEEAKTTGTATFARTPVQSVTLGKVASVGEYLFNGCTGLTEISLPETVTAIGAYAFAGCENLVAVYGLSSVQTIGDYAFLNASKLATSMEGQETLDLSGAVSIGRGAFATADEKTNGDIFTFEILDTVAAYKTVKFGGSLKSVGVQAFYNGGMTAISLPASVQTVGYGAFASADNLTAITIEENENYFAEDGVLYRNVADAYELAAYPAAKTAASYTVKEGTVSVLAYAFNGLNGALEEVELPYSVKLIGDSAFYNSGVEKYIFHSMTAPTLETEVRQEIIDALAADANFGKLNEQQQFFGFYYANFQTLFVRYTAYNPGVTSPLAIAYPSNATGYNNYLYKHYFGTVSSLGVELSDEARAVKALIDGLQPLSVVQSWKTAAVNEENLAKVRACIEAVSAARTQYSTIKDAAQLELIKTEAETLSAIEDELRAVREHFGIAARVVSLSYEGTCKKDYLVGEVFDPTGLTFYITYDDGSKAVADWSALTFPTEQMTLATGRVTIKGYGVSARITVNVQAAAEAPAPTPDEETPSGGCGGSVAFGGVLAGLTIVGAAMMIKKRKEQ